MTWLAVEFVGQFIAFWLTFALVAYVMTRIRKPKSTKHYYNRAFWIAVVLAALVSLSAVFREGDLRISGQSLDAWASLSTAEKQRFKDIVAGVTSDETYLTPDIHREFWVLMDRVTRSPEALEDLRMAVTGPGVEYMECFWEDAQQSLIRGQPVKSETRRRVEERLLSLGMSQSRITENDTLLSRIVAKEPISVRGETVVIDNQMIEATKQSLSQAEKRLDQLFQRTQP